MCDTLKITKSDLIKTYFADDETMQDVVERAFNGEGHCQDYLADWFEKNGHSEKANIWRDMAKTSQQQRTE